MLFKKRGMSAPPRVDDGDEADEEGTEPGRFTGNDGAQRIHVPGRLRGVAVNASVLEAHVKQLSRRSRLGFACEVEVFFLAILLAIIFVQHLGVNSQLHIEAQILAKPFPTAPGASTFASFTDGLIDGQSEYFQWLTNVVFYPIYVLGGPSSSFALGPGYGQPVLTYAPLIQLIRVRTISCPPSSTLLGQPCYPDFSTGRQDTNPYLGVPWSPGNGEPTYYGAMASYPSSGYYFSLPLNTSQAAAELLRLRSATFIDAATRFVSVSLTFYYANLGVVCQVRPVVEISTSGLWLTSAASQCAPMFTAASQASNVFGLQVALVVAEALFLFQLAWNLARFGVDERWLDVVLDLVAAGIMVAQSVVAFTWNALNPTLINGHLFANSAAQQSFYLVEVLYACSVLFSSWRVFRYSELLPVGETARVVSRAAVHGVAIFFANVLVICIFFALCGTTVLGPSQLEWSSSVGAATEILSYLAGEIDYFAVASTQPFGLYFAPIFLLSFVAIFLWYLRAVLVAIVYTAWRDAIRAHRDAGGSTRRRIAVNWRWFEPLRLAVGLPARAGFVSDYALVRVAAQLRQSDPHTAVTFATLRSALANGAAVEEGLEHPRPVGDDALTEQTTRVFASLLASHAADVHGGAKTPSPPGAMPSLTTLRRLSATLHRLEGNASATTKTLVKQLESIQTMARDA